MLPEGIASLRAAIPREGAKENQEKRFPAGTDLKAKFPFHSSKLGEKGILLSRTNCVRFFLIFLRRVRDSNPRYRKRYNRFRVCHDRPLCQLSKGLQMYYFSLNGSKLGSGIFLSLWRFEKKLKLQGCIFGM
jgi:hypothetical protein